MAPRPARTGGAADYEKQLAAMIKGWQEDMPRVDARAQDMRGQAEDKHDQSCSSTRQWHTEVAHSRSTCSSTRSVAHAVAHSSSTVAHSARCGGKSDRFWREKRQARVWALFPRESVAFPSRNVCYSCPRVSVAGQLVRPPADGS